MPEEVRVKVKGLRGLLACISLGLVLSVSGCGAGSSSTGADTATPATSSTGSANTTGTTSTNTTTTTVVPTGSIAMTLSSTFVSAGTSATATATLKDSAGVGVAGAVVTFTTDSNFGVMTPASGTALTNASGNASVILSAAGVSASGAASITARAQVGDQDFSVTRGYSVGASSVAITTPSFGTNPLSTFGSTSVSVTVTSNGAPLANQQVTFSSPCATSGKASLSSAVMTNASGVASGSYQDSGCGTVDVVTASASALATSSASLTVIPPSIGSIQYLSASPAFISLKGTGGAGRQESSVVKFKVVDSANNPLSGKTVAFELSTTVGGLTLSSPSAISNALGEVQVLVLAGTVPTPVRVSASTAGAGGTTLVTQSDQLTVSVGLPDQDSASLSVGTFNIEGWNHDGVPTTITIALADVFNNAVPDGTAVNFTTEGGRVGTLASGAPVGSCTTVNSTCTVTLVSQNPRPADGRVTVLAYAVGEESFIDTNGNGLADTGEFANIGEAFRDDDFDGVRNAAEIYLEFNNNSAYDAAAADPLYNGSMCNTSCSTRKTAHIFKNTEVVFSGSSADITLIDVTAGTTNANVDFGACTDPKATHGFTAEIKDVNGNPMPAGTTVKVTAENGKLTGDIDYIVTNTAAPVVGPQLRFNLTSDCLPVGDTTPVGNLKVTVKTPKGLETTRSIVITN